MDDVYETALNGVGDICLYNGIPDQFEKFLGKEWYANHAQRMGVIKDKYNLQIIVQEGDKNLIADDFAEYRTFPPELFLAKTFYAYGDKLAIMNLEEDNVTIRVITETDVFKSFRILFNIAWNNVAKTI